MLHINDLSYRIEGRPIFEGATAAIPTGHKVGLVGRNGAGKTTLLKILSGELAPDMGTITMPRTARIGHVAQEAPGGKESIVDWVLAADTERAQLLAEAETATDPHRIGEIHERLADINAHSAPARAAQILSGLGFDEDARQRPCGSLSGGWRMRVALAAVLFLEPEILLLDEPTNYLDLEGALWLENYLRSYPHTVIIVSHDRDLLNRAVTAILHLDRGRLVFYSGGYDDFEDTRREKQQLELKLKKKQDDERRRIQAFIDRFKAKATKAKQAQSRVKALAKMKPIAAQLDDRVSPFHLPNPQKALASPLMRFENVSIGYAPDTPVLTGLNLRIDQDDRIALLGQNGNGKSTFAKLIAGKLAPLTGNVAGAKKVDVGYFAQHQLDELASGKSPYDHIHDLMPDATEAQRRTRLGTYGFSADKADTKCDNLSGGEKARLLLALAAFHAPHLLILDEPTNHLDIDSRQALVQALAEFEGAVILISHDRHLIEACADRLWIVRGGTVKSYDGDMDSYRADLLAERGASVRAKAAAIAKTEAPRAARADQRRAAADRRAALAPLKKAMQVAERKVDKISADIARLDKLLEDTEIYTRDPQAAQNASIERGLCAKRLAEAEEEWLLASEAYETASAAAEDEAEA
ncbi:ABC-F family ATP-binding cassette domain-containing protein [Hyphomicrobium sulfonivorans]|uniref:ABC-F family ATP-binding cassette domain-containing protein n=1 Tax=Hyphomicrobium sulfonivorans TaxID=121290 RepID=UPI001570283C|nr:ABC-F family ATP-binding cassette domain-containing protein [Hyphomicrobium sulfonivorans]MBI1648898.1 ABC-F family ATP-binding cassette domain-containing protein [Hyphomicrobium sulfonivorans]NSL70566.1 glycosyl transferase family 1 [Hyphomicrobium sulfonivorans]